MQHINNLSQSINGKLVSDYQSGSDMANVVPAAQRTIINRGDSDAFRPCHEADHLFAQMIR